MKLTASFSAAPISVCNALEEMSSQATEDPVAGIQIAPVLESEGCSYYATEIASGKSVTPHYHSQGNEVYIIFSGSGAIKTWQPGLAEDIAEIQIKRGDIFNIPPGVVHHLINTGTQPLVLLFACPPEHLATDRVIPSSPP
ncbi:cupin domain-containing protein [Pinirhizobacter soli]|uniref:cupin domain-containing protein n=1 Tax=Pinirhizobacter soli TaxID=2786953 RepID=UPI002029E92E|nr:cupin domain-containing protein [Pinirhizobacter soli]